MTDTMQRCVPISTGAISPDMRVNYQFGLVLGVDEFEQEGVYLRERDERAARVLHGYGTASGLRVGARRPDDAPLDVEVRVEPGIGIDQYGRPVVIRSAQCARVGAWIAAEESAATAAEDPSPLDAHMRPSGDVTVYVVAEYSSCLDALVPLPGNPCGADDEMLAASRVRDSWELSLRWDPPPTPRWNGIRDLADIVNTIEFGDDSPAVSDEAALIEHIRALAPGAPPPAVPLPARPRVPRLTAREAIDRLLTVWITEVRPSLAPDLLDPDGPAAFLLATLVVTPAAPFDAAQPEVTAFAPPDDTGRPYIAPTQLLQELVVLGGGVTTIVGGSPIEPPVASSPPIELASVSELTVDGRRRLALWSHLPSPLVLPDEVPVSRDGAAAVTFRATAGPRPDVTMLDPLPGPRLGDGEQLDVLLRLTDLGVDDRGAGITVPLPRWLERSGVSVLGAHDGVLALHHTMSSSPAAPPAERPVRQLATATGIFADRTVPTIELWWHLDREADTDTARIADLPADSLAVAAETDGAAGLVPIPVTIAAIQHNVFHLALDPEVWLRRTRRSPYLRVLVKLEGIVLDRNGMNLVELADDLGVRWADTQSNARLYVAWVRMGAQPG